MTDASLSSLSFFFCRVQLPSILPSSHHHYLHHHHFIPQTSSAVHSPPSSPTPNSQTSPLCTRTETPASRVSLFPPSQPSSLLLLSCTLLYSILSFCSNRVRPEKLQHPCHRSPSTLRLARPSHSPCVSTLGVGERLAANRLSLPERLAFPRGRSLLLHPLVLRARRSIPTLPDRLESTTVHPDTPFVSFSLALSTPICDLFSSSTSSHPDNLANADRHRTSSRIAPSSLLMGLLP